MVIVLPIKNPSKHIKSNFQFRLILTPVHTWNVSFQTVCKIL